MAKAFPPRTIPGEFFVLAYDRYDQTYTLFVDDGSHSSYNLGNDIESVMRYFKVINVAELGNRAIDLAKEFGASQCVPSEDRVFRINTTPQRGESPLKFRDEADTAGGFYLPSL